ncbi:hypothetical protein ACWDKQ_21060 [Saccharopolyspora sp. NPDC000995]
MILPEAGNQAFADESFREAEVGGYYILAAVVFETGSHDPARSAMHELRGGRDTYKLHWNEMTSQEKHNAAKTVAELEGFHVVVVGTPVPSRRQERARALCLTKLIYELHSYGVNRLLMEGRSRALNDRDVATVRGARYELPKGAVFQIEHLPGSREALLWAADIVAGAVRFSREGSDSCRELLDARLYQIDLAIDC